LLNFYLLIFDLSNVGKFYVISLISVF
jgi:hypothetical protein